MTQEALENDNDSRLIDDARIKMDGLQEWQALIEQANRAFHDQNYPCAIELNKRALRHAANMFEEAICDTPDDAIMAILVSYLNQAEAYEQTEEFNRCCCLYERAYTFVSCLMRDDETRREVRLAAMKASSCVLMEWMQFLTRQRSNVNSERIKRYQHIISRGVHPPVEPTYH